MRIWARSVLKNAGRYADATPFIASCEEYKTAKTIFCYVSVKNEPDTRRFIERAISDGKTVCVPRCISNGMMDAVEIKGTSCLVNNRFGIPEPNDGKIISVSEIDLAVIPCLCADEYGGRLGHGGGYYDRFLARFTGCSVILCRNELKVDKIPTEPHDISADKVIFI